jgi:hypothetical protein
MRAVPAGEIKTVSVSLGESSVDVFVPYLGNLSVLLVRRGNSPDDRCC